MLLINKISDAPYQRFFLTGNPNQRIETILRFLPTQNQWTVSLTQGDFSVTNLFVQNSPNMLRAFKNIIPFGMACISADGNEPLYIDDFKNGRISLYLLNQADIDTIEASLYGN